MPIHAADSSPLPTYLKSVYKITRELKREQNSLFNCLNSILADASFVSEIKSLYPALPLLANLRCGLWYTSKPDSTCYFKSTDGHNGNWSFSTTRLNLHVAELAGRKGGCLIVDATRKGKRFPDAFSKTVPIWAAVLNRAVARVRAQSSKQPAPAVEDIQTCIPEKPCPEPLSGGSSPRAHKSSMPALPLKAPQLSLNDWLSVQQPHAHSQKNRTPLPAAPGPSSPPHATAAELELDQLFESCLEDKQVRNGQMFGALFGASEPPTCNSRLAFGRTCSAPACLHTPSFTHTQEHQSHAERIAKSSYPSTGYLSPAFVRRTVSHDHLPSAFACPDILEELPVDMISELPLPIFPDPACLPPVSAGEFPRLQSLLTPSPSCPLPCSHMAATRMTPPSANKPSLCRNTPTSTHRNLAEIGASIICGTTPSEHDESSSSSSGSYSSCVDPDFVSEPILGSAFAAMAASSSRTALSDADPDSLSCSDSFTLFLDSSPPHAGLASSSRYASSDSDDDGETSGSSSACTNNRHTMALCNSKAETELDSGSSSSRSSHSSSSSNNTAAAGPGAAAAAAGGGCTERQGSCSSESSWFQFRVPHEAAGGEEAPEPVFELPSDGVQWDEELHLPLWVSANERRQIEARLDGWVDDLLESGADIEAIAKVLVKPLRPLWMSQESRIWTNQVAQPHELPFTPLLLLSASQATSYHRPCCHLAYKDVEDERECWTYVYVPGAGDDEESWACSLTPGLFWQNLAELIGAGPHGVYDVVKTLLCPPPSEPLLPPCQLAALKSRGGEEGGVETDQHHLKPKGCDSAEGGNVTCSEGCVFWLGATGMAIGSAAALQLRSLWLTVDAVLDCSPAAVTQVVTPPPLTLAPTTHPRLLCLPIESSKMQRGSVEGQLHTALAFVSGHLAAGRRVLVVDAQGVDQCVCVAVAALLNSPHQPTLHHAPPHDLHTAPSALPPQPPPRHLITKASVRQQLAFLSSCYPPARPTRGNLKQVFNFFQPPTGPTSPTSPTTPDLCIDRMAPFRSPSSHVLSTPCPKLPTGSPSTTSPRPSSQPWIPTLNIPIATNATNATYAADAADGDIGTAGAAGPCVCGVDAVIDDSAAASDVVHTADDICNVEEVVGSSSSHRCSSLALGGGGSGHRVATAVT